MPKLICSSHIFNFILSTVIQQQKSCHNYSFSHICITFSDLIHFYEFFLQSLVRTRRIDRYKQTQYGRRLSSQPTAFHRARIIKNSQISGRARPIRNDDTRYRMATGQGGFNSRGLRGTTVRQSGIIILFHKIKVDKQPSILTFIIHNMPGVLER